MPSQPLRRSARLAAKVAKVHNADTIKPCDKGTRDATANDHEARKVTAKASRRASISRSKSCSLQSLDQTPRSSRRVKARKTAKPSQAPKKSKARGITFGRNAVAEFNKENPPNVVEHLTDDEAQELFPHHEVTPSAAIDEEQTRRNEEILAEWDENFEDLDQSDDSTVHSDDSTDDSERGEYHRYYSGSHRNGGYVVVEEKETGRLTTTASSIVNECSSKGGTNKMPVMRVDVYFCDFCERGVRRTSKYYYK